MSKNTPDKKIQDIVKLINTGENHVTIADQIDFLHLQPQELQDCQINNFLLPACHYEENKKTNNIVKDPNDINYYMNIRVGFVRSMLPDNNTELKEDAKNTLVTAVSIAANEYSETLTKNKDAPIPPLLDLFLSNEKVVEVLDEKTNSQLAKDRSSPTIALSKVLGITGKLAPLNKIIEKIEKTKAASEHEASLTDSTYPPRGGHKPPKGAER